MPDWIGPIWVIRDRVSLRISTSSQSGYSYTFFISLLTQDTCPRVLRKNVPTRETFVGFRPERMSLDQIIDLFPHRRQLLLQGTPPCQVEACLRGCWSVLSPSFCFVYLFPQ